MQNDELEIWWSSLSIAQKERIAFKGQSKASPEKEVDMDLVRYPACTRWWNSLPTSQKLFIHNHCVDRHGYLLKEWDEAQPYGD